MGNWHCVPSSCAEVVYQKYESPLVRWRYPGEDWHEIEGDNYSTKENLKQGQNNYQYYVNVRRKCVSGSSPGYSVDDVATYLVYGPVQGIKYDKNRDLFGARSTHPNSFIKTPEYNILPAYLYARGYANELVWYSDISSNAQPPDLNQIEIVGIYPRYGQDDTNNKECVFTVYKNGQTIYTETRAVCPEVEKIPCKLSSVRKTSNKLRKLPFLEKIEVVPYQYSAYKSPGVPAPIVQTDPIPPECLNIYQNAIYVIPPSGQGIYPNATPFDSLIAQICSAPGCPPPQYQVICDCGDDCKSCPDGTCAVECGNDICCYNDYGISIQSIPKSEYCGGTA